MSTEPVRSTAHERIVVVEDEGIVALDLKGKLRSLGYEVPAVVATGEEAVAAAAAERPDLVLMDIRLGGAMDGVEAAARISEQLRIPVIFLTAHSDEATLRRAKAVEPLDYLLKPVSEQELQAKLDLAFYRYQLEKVIRDSEARYTAVVQQCTEGILLVDIDGGRVLEANPALQQLLEYGPGEIEALTLYEIATHPREVVDRELRSLRERRFGRYEEARFRRRDGRLVEVEATASLIAYGDSEAVCLVVRDITARREAEAALQAAEEELERQRSLSVRMDRLRALGEIAAAIAHEFSQPLVGVRSLADYLRMSLHEGWPLREEELRERLELIVRQADRMAQVLEHVHSFYHHDVQKADLLPVQLDEVAGRATELLRAQFQAHGVELSCVLGGDLPPVMANTFSLEEVVLHLLINGRDAVEDKGAPGGRVELRTGQSADGSEVRLAIADNGVGIPAALQEDVFRPFYTTKRPERGTGLGMAISRSIVEQFGGRVELQSVLGEGTTVTVVLPSAR